MSQPLTPPDCDLRGMPFMPLHVVRLVDSDLYALATGEEFKAAVTLWCKAWLQVPAASLPNDDRILAHLSGAGGRWRKVKDMALRGFVLCDDGRLHHPVLAENALEAWERRGEWQEQQNNKTARQQRWRDRVKEISARLRALGVTPPTNATLASLERLLVDAEASTAPSTGDATETALTGTGTGTGIDSVPDGTGAEAPSIDPEKKAWDDALSLLTTTGRMKAGHARGFIGKLLSDNGIKARDLLPAIGNAIANQTQDPAAYLRKAAVGVASRNGGGGAAPAQPDEITRADWERRVGMWRKDGWWQGAWGPRPDERGCVCPPDLLEPRP